MGLQERTQSMVIVSYFTLLLSTKAYIIISHLVFVLSYFVCLCSDFHVRYHFR
jgi:hypothetical protein